MYPKHWIFLIAPVLQMRSSVGQAYLQAFSESYSAITPSVFTPNPAASTDSWALIACVF